MARLPRLHIPNCPMLLELHAIGGQPVFKSKQAYRLFHERMPRSADEEQVSIHAYCLMPSAVAMLIASPRPESAGRFIQNLNRYFSAGLKVLQPNSASTLWEPRFKSTVVQPGPRSLLACLYVELMAQRLALTPDVLTYPWSSYGAHAGAVTERWVNDLPEYWALGNTPFERQAAYRQLAEQGWSLRDMEALQTHLNTGWLWGDEDFADQAQVTANRPVRPRSRGRPSTKIQKGA